MGSGGRPGKEGSPVGSEQVGARLSPQRDWGPGGDIQDREGGIVLGEGAKVTDRPEAWDAGMVDSVLDRGSHGDRA